MQQYLLCKGQLQYIKSKVEVCELGRSLKCVDIQYNELSCTSGFIETSLPIEGMALGSTHLVGQR